MLLTIIIPAWNAEKTLDECLNSLFAQTVSDFEVRIVNDGSTDGTEGLLRLWQARFPEKLSFETVENGGQGRARNLALEKARGQFIGFVDSDDWIEPDMYEKLLAVSQKENADLTLCEVTAHFPDGSTDQERIYRPDRPMASAGFANNKLFRRELLDGIRFAEEKLWYEDLEFTAIAIHRAKKNRPSGRKPLSLPPGPAFNDEQPERRKKPRPADRDAASRGRASPQCKGRF